MKIYLKQGESVPFLDGIYTVFSGWYSLTSNSIIMIEKSCSRCEANCGNSWCFTNDEDGDKVEKETEELIWN